MNYSDYCEKVKNDAIDYIDEQFECGFYTEDTSFEDVYDELFVSDGVTGNGSGSYTFCSAESRDNVAEAIWDDKIISLLEYMCLQDSVFNYLKDNNPEAVDVTIRCAILSEVSGDIEEHFDEKVEELVEQNHSNDDSEDED